MDATDRSGDEIRSLKKRKSTCNLELPSKPSKRAKKFNSKKSRPEGTFTPATGQESGSDTQPQNLLLQTQFSPSHFSGAHHFISTGGTYNNVFGNYVVMAEPSHADSPVRSPNGIIEGSPVASVEEVSIEQEIFKGRGYRLHAAKMSGRIVAMKVYEGNRARERCLEAAKFNQTVIHPNIPHLIAVSPLNSGPPFLIFDGEYDGAVHDILGHALKKDLKQILTLGLQTVVGLSSGLDYLQDMKYPFVSVGLEHFTILSRRGKPVLTFDPDDLSQVNQFDHQIAPFRSAEAVFHELCGRTFDSACKAHYESQKVQRPYADEFDSNLVGNSVEELDSNDLAPSSPISGRPSPLKPSRISPPSGRRQELVWKSPTAEAVNLNDISHQFRNFLNDYLLSSQPALNRRRGRYRARTAHRCPGYNRVEITLTANISRSAIVSHSSPIPHEICPVCGKVVKDTDIFNCVCGGNDDEAMPTVQCTTCSEWHHRPCVNLGSLVFVCERCQHHAQAGLSRQIRPLPDITDPHSFGYDDTSQQVSRINKSITLLTAVPPPADSETTSPPRHGHIPRPSNAYILFRSSFLKNRRVSTELETNPSTLSKTISMTWQSLPAEEQLVWHTMAKEAVAEHKRKYPQYVFRPVHTKAKWAENAKVRRGKQMDVERSNMIAQLLVEGKRGPELIAAVEKFDRQRR